MFSFFNKYRPVNVLIYGKHSDDWTKALEPSAEVWKSLANVKEVAIQADADGNLSLCALKKCRTVIIPLLEEHIEKLPRSLPNLAPTPDTVRTLKNKLSFAEYLKKHNLTQFAPTHYELLENVKYPCVLKRLDLNASNGVAFITSSADLQNHLMLEPWLGHPYLVQEYIPGDHDNTLNCIVKNGKIIWYNSFFYSHPHSSILNYPADIFRREPTNIEIIFIEKILRPLKYSGPCNIDYKITTAGEVKIMEINPRLGGSLMREENTSDLATALGVIIKYAR